MPRIVIRLEVDGGESGQDGGSLFEEFLITLQARMPEYDVVCHELLGTTLTEDEIAELRFSNEGGNDD
jgi:hypothetical protein